MPDIAQDIASPLALPSSIIIGHHGEPGTLLYATPAASGAFRYSPKLPVHGFITPKSPAILYHHKIRANVKRNTNNKKELPARVRMVIPRFLALTVRTSQAAIQPWLRLICGRQFLQHQPDNLRDRPLHLRSAFLAKGGDISYLYGKDDDLLGHRHTKSAA